MKEVHLCVQPSPLLLQHIDTAKVPRCGGHVEKAGPLLYPNLPLSNLPHQHVDLVKENIRMVKNRSRKGGGQIVHNQ